MAGFFALQAFVTCPGFFIVYQNWLPTINQFRCSKALLLATSDYKRGPFLSVLPDPCGHSDLMVKAWC